ncbi:hypothetical protein RVU69_17515, partial [Bordetella avium]
LAMRVGLPLPGEIMLHYPELTDQQIIDALYELFAGEADIAFGQDREWWADAIIDGGHDALCRIALTALSTTPVPEYVIQTQRELRADLIGIARLLMGKAHAEGREIHA